jgi:hypothetical protein
MKTFKHKFLFATILTIGLSCNSYEDLWDHSGSGKVIER